MVKVALIYGGVSKEREISIKSGKAVEKALKELNYDYKVFDIVEPLKFIKEISEYKPDVAFIALHGKVGEDGIIQGVLEFLNIPYTGSGVKTSAVCMDKETTKDILKSHNLPVPESFTIKSMQEIQNKDIKFPVVVKAATEGSSIGVYIVKNQQKLEEALKEAFKLDKKVLIEEYIKGREITVSILNGKPLDIVEIVVEEGFYDFQNKYITGKTKYICPAQIEKDTYLYIQDLALKAYSILECKGAARVDFILSDKQPYILELNTIPGMTEHSLLPKAAKTAGIDFDNLVKLIIEDALNENR